MPRTGSILAVLALGGGAYALLQSLVVPALPVLKHDLHTTTTGVAWIFTSYLLAASVVTPIAGRLGDMFGKKRVLVLSLVGLTLGSLLAALATSLPLMIVARTTQGLGGAIFPLAFGIIRDEFPRHRVAGAIALISGLLGIGSGALKVVAMDGAMRLPMKVSSATSNFMIGVTAAASAGIYLGRGDVDPTLVAPVALGVLAGAMLGARLLPRLANRHVRWIFLPVLVVIGIQTLLRGFGVGA